MLYTYANIPPQTQGGLTEAILSLETRSRKWPRGKVFVKMSAVWSEKVTGRRRKMLANRWWCTRWQSISICLVRSWKTSLCTIWIALRLSQCMTVSEECVRPITSNSQQRARSSDVVSARAQYSALVLKRDTICCFLLCQEIRESPKKKQKPIVKRRSVGSPAQSTSK